MRLIGGWHLWSLLRLACLDCEVVSVSYPKIDTNLIAEMGQSDMIYTTSLACTDEVAQRVRAIVSFRHAEKEGHVSRRRLLAIKQLFDLPTRKRDSLAKLIQGELPTIQEFIMSAPAPLGGHRVKTDDQ